MERVKPAEPENTCAVIVAKLATLPPFGPAVLKLLSICIDDASAIESFEDVFKSDPALTGELLAMANSPVFGRLSRAQTIASAIMYLGLERVRGLAATSALRSHTQRGPRHHYLSSVWAHSIASAVAAEALGSAFGCPGLYTLGLTHDLGRLGLFLAGGQPYGDALASEFLNLEQANEVELKLFGITHCEAGSLVAAAWGFPEGLATCMSQHHTLPAEAADIPQGLVATACRMADSLGFPEVALTEPFPWPDLGPAQEHHHQLEPEVLWDEITRRITDLGHL